MSAVQPQPRNPAPSSDYQFSPDRTLRWREGMKDWEPVPQATMSDSQPAPAAPTTGPPPKPVPLPVLVENIPEDLKRWPQWVVWRYEWNTSKKSKTTGEKGDWDKPPRNARTGGMAKSTDRQTWSSFEDAITAYRAGGWDGIGFAPAAEDPFVFFDFDACVIDGVVNQHHRETAILPLNSYTEFSPSHTGIRVIVKGVLPGRGHKHPGKRAEVYDRGHYLTITGQRIVASPAEIFERPEVIAHLYERLDPSVKPPPASPADPPLPASPSPSSVSDRKVMTRCRQARGRDKFAALFDRGEVAEYDDDDSAADLGLCCLLARWTADAEQIDRLFRQSKLMREKWDREDYRERTIAKALESAAEQRAHAAGRFFDPQQGFIPMRLGEYLNSEARIVRGKDGRLYRYRDGVYRPDGLDFAAGRTRELLNDQFRRRHWLETKEWLLADEAVIGVEAADRECLNLPNGRLQWRTGILMPHSDEVLDTIRIPVSWHENASCPAFLNFLHQTLPPDAIDLVWELIGYLLLPDARFQKAVLLLGGTGTGKGTLLNTIRCLLGLENVSALTLHAFSEDRFAAASLFGRLANLCGDLDARNVERSDMFKQVTGEDAVTAQFKYGPLFSFVPYCRLIFSANEAPPSADQSEAYFARWIVVPMTTRYRGTAAEDTGLRAKLASPDELEGILRLAVAALGRLMDRGRFQLPDSVEAANKAFRASLDTVRAYVDEECVLAIDFWTRGRKLFESYAYWCDANGRRAVSSTKFYERLRADYPMLTESKRDGYSGFKGIVTK